MLEFAERVRIKIFSSDGFEFHWLDSFFRGTLVTQTERNGSRLTLKFAIFKLQIHQPEQSIDRTKEQPCERIRNHPNDLHPFGKISNVSPSRLWDCSFVVVACVLGDVRLEAGAFFAWAN